MDAVVVAHGSKLTAELLAGVRRPALFLQPEHDQQMPPELLEHVKQVGSIQSICTSFRQATEHTQVCSGVPIMQLAMPLP